MSRPRIFQRLWIGGQKNIAHGVNGIKVFSLHYFMLDYFEVPLWGSNSRMSQGFGHKVRGGGLHQGFGFSLVVWKSFRFGVWLQGIGIPYFCGLDFPRFSCCGLQNHSLPWGFVVRFRKRYSFTIVRLRMYANVPESTTCSLNVRSFMTKKHACIFFQAWYRYNLKPQEDYFLT